MWGLWGFPRGSRMKINIWASEMTQQVNSEPTERWKKEPTSPNCPPPSTHVPPSQNNNNFKILFVCVLRIKFLKHNPNLVIEKGYFS